MRSWIKTLISSPGAFVDAKDHLDALARDEDRLDKADSLEKLWYQRGKVDGIKMVLFQLTSTQKGA